MGERMGGGGFRWLRELRELEEGNLNVGEKNERESARGSERLREREESPWR